MLAASLNLYSTPAGDVNIQPVEAQMAPVLQQFKFVAARLAWTTTTSLDDIQGSSRSSGSEKPKQLNSYISSIGIGPTPPADALDFGSQQKHQYHKHRTCWLRLPRKLTSSGFFSAFGLLSSDSGTSE